jgi:hypothetical protein
VKYTVYLTGLDCDLHSMLLETLLLFSALLLNILYSLIAAGNLVFHMEKKHEERYGLVHHLQKEEKNDTKTKSQTSLK